MATASDSDLATVLSRLDAAGALTPPATIAEQLTREFYRRQWPIVEQYRREGWVTIGGAPAGGKEHAGGTPVELDGQGRIVKGPAALKDENVDQLGGIKPPQPSTPFELSRPENKPANAAPSHQEPLFDRHSAAKTPSEQSILERNPGLKKGSDGRVVGHAQVTVNDLRADPSRFQYKVKGIDPTSGVTEELKAVGTFNPEFAGQLLVWHDPEDGKDYVINGHHRFELAKRLGYADTLPVYFLDAKTAKEARARGALANIAEGRGTALDAAKFMRDTGTSADDLSKKGISLRGSVARDASDLTKLSDPIFQSLATGKLDENRALSIGRNLSDHAKQNYLLKEIDRREAKSNKPIPDAVLSEMAQEMELAASNTKHGRDLFGDFDETFPLFFERNELKAWLRKQLVEQKTAFASVAKTRRKDTLESAGRNVIDVDANREASRQAAADLDDFSREANLRGPLNDALNEFAKELSDEPKRRKDIQGRLLKRIREVIQGSDAETSGGGDGRDRNSATFGRPGNGRAERESLISLLAVEFYSRGFDVDQPVTTPVIEDRGKISQVAANYRSGFSSARCGSCEFYRHKACANVQGEIWPDDICDLYVPRREDPDHNVDRYSWQDQPRGQPGNAGQWGPGGGASGEPDAKKPDSADKPESKHRARKTAAEHQKLAMEPGPDLSHLRETAGVPAGAPRSVKQNANYAANPDALFAQAAGAMPGFQDVLGSGVGATLGAQVFAPGSDHRATKATIDANRDKSFVLIAGLKGQERSKDKVREKYRGDWSRLTDILRATVLVPSHEDFADVVQTVRGEAAKAGWTISTFEDNFHKPNPFGYRDVKLTLTSPDGHHSELQINTTTMYAAKEISGGHEHYEEYRKIAEPLEKSGEPPTEEQAAKMAQLRSDSQELYGQHWEESQSVPPLFPKRE